MAEPVLPRYEASALSDILPSVSAHLGLKGFDDVLGLPASDRYVILLVDGLGRALLEASADRAPHLFGRLPDAATLTSVVPSTTAAALTSLGTGLPPGQHGVAGYTFRNPFSGGLLNALTWEPGLSGLDIQPRLTVFEKLARDGVQVTRVMPARFGGTGLTEAGLRGGRLSGVTDESDGGRRIDQVVDAAASGGRSLVYCYERALDHTGHGAGWQSAEWGAVLGWVDDLAAGLRAALPDDVRLLITADHGMVDVAADARILVEDEPDLLAGVDLLAGEARFRQLYTGEPDAVASRWRDRLGEGAWVRTRAEAADEDWFGYLVPNLASRFGDVLVAASDPLAILTRAMPGELKLIGMHGSLTPAEMYVPLIVE